MASSYLSTFTRSLGLSIAPVKIGSMAASRSTVVTATMPAEDRPFPAIPAASDGVTLALVAGAPCVRERLALSVEASLLCVPYLSPVRACLLTRPPSRSRLKSGSGAGPQSSSSAIYLRALRGLLWLAFHRHACQSAMPCRLPAAPFPWNTHHPRFLPPLPLYIHSTGAPPNDPKDTHSCTAFEVPGAHSSRVGFRGW